MNDRVEAGLVRLLRIVFLQGEKQKAVTRQCHVHGFDRRRPVDGERLDSERKHDGLPECEDRQFAGIGAFGLCRHGSPRAYLTCYDRTMSLDERDFFNSRNETRTDKLSCPRCKRVNEYQMRWVVNTRKDRIPGGADERDRALYAKLRDYMVRVDDAVTCKTCGKKFDIPSQHSMVFIEKGAPAGRTYTGGDDDDTRFNR